MSKYIRLLALFGVLQLCLAVIAVVFVGPSNHYIAAVKDKERLLASAPSPRLILVGGSNLAFGVDSSRLQAGLGDQYKVVNMGLHAGLGLDFILAETLAEVRKGDVVVLSPEYAILWFDAPQPVELAQAIYHRPQAWRNVPADKRLWLLGAAAVEAPGPMLHELASSVAYKIVPSISSRRQHVYYRDAFNPYGDNVAAWDLPGALSVPKDASPENPSLERMRSSLRAMERFAQHSEGRGAQVAFSFPPVPEYWWELNQQDVYLTQRMLASETGLTVIGAPDREVYAEADFFDSADHLRGSAVHRRTQQMLSALEQWLSD